jgi:FMN phosphatase YigB (HAD superfamily)
VRAISFDFDGVLAKSPFAYGVLFPVLDSLATEYSSREEISPEDGRNALRETLWGSFRGRIADENYVEAYDWQTLVELTANELELDFTESLPELTQAYSDKLSAEGDRSLVYPHAHETLGKFRDSGACLILLTNGYRDYQYPTAHALGLAEFFPHFYASDDLGTVKPFREAFEIAFAACTGAGTGTDQAGNTVAYKDRIHIGDSLTQDVAGARGAGIYSVWIHHELPEELLALSPVERVTDDRIEPIISRKLAHENQSAATFTREQCQPDAAVASLDELVSIIA